VLLGHQRAHIGVRVGGRADLQGGDARRELLTSLSAVSSPDRHGDEIAMQRSPAEP
jgi:hypothetical protein